jgi:GGDEF domain-containing protein
VKANLKKITDKTIQDLLQHEIIMPSSYFKSFDQNAKHLSVNIKDDHFESEVSHIIVDELKNINSYMKKAAQKIDALSEATEDAQKAIQEKDESKLTSINATLVTMKNEIDALRDLIYLDPLTKTYNRKWVYNHAIEEDGRFKNKGLLILIDLNDCHYLAEKYGEQLADSVIIYITKFLTNKFSSEKISFDIARYSHNQLLLFVSENTHTTINSFLKSIRLELANTTLKNKSGLMFKTKFHFGIVKYTADDGFQRSLEGAAELARAEEENT